MLRLERNSVGDGGTSASKSKMAQKELQFLTIPHFRERISESVEINVQ
jgi:hypothetical protein